MMKIRMYIGLISLLMTFSIYASPSIEHWQTNNGARVYFVAAPELPMIDIKVVFDAGSARDGKQAGLALLTNAMLNEGAGGLNVDQLAVAFEDVGAQFSNGSQRDMASVSLRSLTDKNALEPALAMFNTVLTQADFPQDAFERIKKQILIGLQAEKQSPSAIATRQFHKALYGTHAYANMPIGNDVSVKKIKRDDIEAFYQRYYVANNAIIVLVGAVDIQYAKLIAEQVSSGLKPGVRSAKIAAVSPIKSAQTIDITHPSSQTHIMMGQLGVKRGDHDYFPLYVGNHILGGSGLVSRLSDEVREKRGLSYSVYSYFSPMHEVGPYMFGLTTRNDQAQQALTVMTDTLKNFIKKGPLKEELIAAKQNITGGFALRVDSNSKIANYLAMIGFYDLPLDYLDTFKRHVEAVTLADIKSAYSRRIDANKMITLLVGGDRGKE